MKCLYHVDADGRCAGYWVSKAFQDFDPNDFIMINYGWGNDWLEKVEENETVVIVDFSIEPDVMRELLKKTTDVIWIDHHKSAIEKYEGFEHDIAGLRSNLFAGCMLTYCYFFEMNEGELEFNEKMPDAAPYFTKLIADHDIWKFNYGNDTRRFMLGFDLIEDIKPYDSDTWEQLKYIDKIKEMIASGESIEKWRAIVSARSRKSKAFEYDFNGTTICCFNNNTGNSTYFGDDYDKYDAVCLFGYDGKRKMWTYTFYSGKEYIDCSKIVTSFLDDPDTLSAGGHKGAAGLQSKKFIFE